MSLEYIDINGRRVGTGYPVYIVAEMSANHNQSFDDAVAIIRAAKEAGADAVKLQTYTADTMTIDSDEPPFVVSGETAWGGQTLHGLYQQAYTPWEWQPELKKIGDEIGVEVFSTPFDATAVDFLEEMGVNVYKVASFEVTDIPLLRRIAATGKPMIISTGMATMADIDEAVRTVRAAGNEQFILLRCSSAYPSPPEALNIRTIPHMREAFGVPTGLSDHTLGIGGAIASVALGAVAIEKHFTLSRAQEGPDSFFSLEPDELKTLVDGVRAAEAALGTVTYGPSEAEKPMTAFQRSLFFVQDVRAGETLTPENVRVIRPADGLPPRFYDQVIGRKAARNVKRGTPVDWPLVAG